LIIKDFEVPVAGVQPFFEISVIDPQKVTDTLNSYTAYTVLTKVNTLLSDYDAVITWSKDNVFRFQRLDLFGQ
jgi:hypothetical protein